MESNFEMDMGDFSADSGFQDAVDTGPIESEIPDYSEPSVPDYGEPAEPDYAEPVEPDYAEPVDPEIIEPAEPEYAEPVEPDDIESIESTEIEYPEPVEPDLEPEGTPNTWEQPNVPGVVGPEKTEIYHSPETIPEKEPGTGPKPSFDQPPDDAPVEDTIAQGMLGKAQQGEGDWSLPKNVSPSEIKVTTRDDGKTSIVYGKGRDESGRITGDHGHTIIGRDGKTDFARTQKGIVIEDTGE